MKLEFQEHIDFYASNYPHQHFSKYLTEREWGDKKQAEEYLRKYWLPKQEYLSIWKPIQNKIFVQGNSLPDLIYHREFEMIAVNGGCLFVEDDFRQLQKAMFETEEKHFVVIQHSQEYTHGQPMFRMKFPINITWEELRSGNYISAVLIEMAFNEYYVFGVNGNWGKYSANDYERPLDIIGFKSNFTSVFQEHFKLPKEEREEIREWLPQKYKVLIK